MGRIKLAQSGLAALVTIWSLQLAAQPDIHYHPGTTRKVSQLTGDWDRAWGVPTLSQTNTRAGFWATDLGSIVEHKDRLLFLFGDTWGGRDGLLDTFGISSSVDPWNIQMDVPLASDGKWQPINPPGLFLAEYGVPSHGISVDGSIYAVFTQPAPDNAIMRRSNMIVSHDDGETWENLYQLDNGNPVNPVFVNVWLERHDGFIYMFGSGAYRASSPTVARIREEDFPQRAAWEYYAGRTFAGTPVWSSSASDSARLFFHNQVGEFSCVYVEQLSSWVMLYNSLQPRGIVMRTAPDPLGPWSAPKVILNPADAYGDYMHISWDTARVDMMSDPGRHREYGGEYAPYLISRFTTGTAERCELYYTMSTWNPYQVVIMKSVVGTSPPPPFPPVFEQVLDNDRWHRFPAGVADDFPREGIPHITTFTVEQGDANRGWLWQKLPEGTQSISFQIHGGQAEVFLIENFTGLPAAGEISQISSRLRAGDYGRIVRRATGVNSNTPTIPWTWPATAFDTSSLGVVVLDDQTEGWGFVSLSQLTVQAPPVPSDVEEWPQY